MKKLFINLKDKVISLWNRLPDGLRRIIHTLWQVIVSAILVGITAAGSAHDVQTALTIIYTTALAAIKAGIIKLIAAKVED